MGKVVSLWPGGQFSSLDLEEEAVIGKMNTEKSALEVSLSRRVFFFTPWLFVYLRFLGARMLNDCLQLIPIVSPELLLVLEEWQRRSTNF